MPEWISQICGHSNAGQIKFGLSPKSNGMRRIMFEPARASRFDATVFRKWTGQRVRIDWLNSKYNNRVCCWSSLSKVLSMQSATCLFAFYWPLWMFASLDRPIASRQLRIANQIWCCQSLSLARSCFASSFQLLLPLEYPVFVSTCLAIKLYNLLVTLYFAKSILQLLHLVLFFFCSCTDRTCIPRYSQSICRLTYFRHPNGLAEKGAPTTTKTMNVSSPTNGLAGNPTFRFRSVCQIQVSCWNWPVIFFHWLKVILFLFPNLMFFECTCSFWLASQCAGYVS